MTLSLDFSSQNLKYNVKCLDNRAVVFVSGWYKTKVTTLIKTTMALIVTAGPYVHYIYNMCTI